MAATCDPTKQTKGSVLFLAEDKETRDAIETLLRRSGYDVVVVGRVAEGLRIMRRRAFDLILLDWYSGIEVCQVIRTFDRKTPVFFYIDFSPGSAIPQALSAGAQGCFIKPALMSELASTISASLRMLGHDVPN